MRASVGNLFCTAALLYSAAAAAEDDPATLLADLRAIAADRSAAYNCTFSISVYSPTLGGLSATSPDATPDTKFAWGSITKMWTAASVMQLVANGTLRLDEPFAPMVDEQLAAMKRIGFSGMSFSTVRDLWGPDVDAVTVHDLLHMQSGIRDFDTAMPSFTGKSLDPFRATVYANPKEDFLEPKLFSLPWVATKNLSRKPGYGFQYSSTNFGLLGLMLSRHAGVDDYREFNQSAFVPPQLAHLTKDITWAQRGSPLDNGVIEGFDRTTYNGQDPKSGGVSVGDVHGVFSGWSASDFLGPPRVVAELGYNLWGKAGSLVPSQFVEMMVPRPLFMTFYGLGSQNVGLMGITGNRGELGVAYGHLGATYGYDSIMGYNPKLDVSIAIATNIETQSQTQPADAFCKVYNRVKNFLLKEPVQTCTWQTSGYYGGRCKCTSDEAVVLV